MSDHEYIYLQPECCADEYVGRLWCETPDLEDCEEGRNWTRYVRSDLYEKVVAELESLKIKALMSTAEPVGEPVAILCRESCEETQQTWFNYLPIKPGTALHSHRLNSSGWEVMPVYSKAPPADVLRDAVYHLENKTFGAADGSSRYFDGIRDAIKALKQFAAMGK